MVPQGLRQTAQPCLLRNHQTDVKEGIWAEINGNHVVRVVTSYDIYTFFLGLIFSSLLRQFLLIYFQSHMPLFSLFTKFCTIPFARFFPDLSHYHSFRLILNSLPAFLFLNISMFLSFSGKLSELSPQRHTSVKRINTNT